MNVTDLNAQLRRDEGEKLSVYQDSLGYATIGVGRMVDGRKGGGISTDEAAMLLNNDIARVRVELLQRLPWFVHLDPVRQGVLMNMAFQMGINGVMAFQQTLEKVQGGDYAAAADRMLQSKWATQTPERANRLAKQMRDGVWQ
jgi:lysozyme